MILPCVPVCLEFRNAASRLLSNLLRTLLFLILPFAAKIAGIPSRRHPRSALESLNWTLQELSSVIYFHKALLYKNTGIQNLKHLMIQQSQILCKRSNVNKCQDQTIYKIVLELCSCCSYFSTFKIFGSILSIVWSLLEVGFQPLINTIPQVLSSLRWIEKL